MSWTTYKGLQVPSSSTGDAGENLTSNFEALADRTTGTVGSVVFIGSLTYAAEDNANFFFDDTNYYLGIGTNTPGAGLEVYAAAPELRLTDTSGRHLFINGPTSANASIIVSDSNAGLDITTYGYGAISFFTDNVLRAVIAGDTVSTTLAISGSISTAIATQTGDYTLAGNDSVILADATSAAFTLTLPTAVGCGGQEYRLKKIDSSANAVTIATTSSQTIDGNST